MPAINFKKILGWIEEQPFTFGGYITSVLLILFVRLLLEYFSSNSAFAFDVFLFFDGLHSIFWFLALKATMVLLLSSITNKSTILTLHTTAFLFPVIFVAPLIDIFFSNGLGTQMTYLHPHDWQEFFSGLVSFMQSDKFGLGATLGLTIEVVIILLGVSVYVYLLSDSLVKGVIASLITYAVIYLYATYPFLLNMVFEKLSIPNDTTLRVFNRTAVFSLMIMVILQATVILRNSYKSVFNLFVEDIRALRILHYVILFLLGGSFVFFRFRVDLDSILLLKLILLLCCFIMVVIHAIVTNNIYDREIDKVTNTDRPLVRGQISVPLYTAIGNTTLLLGLLLAFITGFYNFFFLFLFAAGYYVYSCPPFRIKRVVLISKMYLGAISLIVFMWGYLFFSNDGVMALNRFPHFFTVFFIVVAGTMGNFIDLKDTKGDKSAGVLTLPVLIGEQKTKWIISFFAVIAFASMYWVIDIPRLMYLIPIGIVVYLYFLNRKNYVERYLFLSYLGMLAFAALAVYSKFNPDSALHNLFI